MHNIKESFSRAFLVLFLVSGLILVGTVNFGVVHATTEVTGIIGSDTVWTKANSPYNLAGPVLVSEGVTLTIEAGTIVNLNDYYIRVQGTLRAIGSDTDSIRINLGDIEFKPGSTSWNEQTGSGCIIENMVLNSSSISIENASPKITHNTINGDITIKQYSTGTPMITYNEFVGSIFTHGGTPVIVNNSITNPYSPGEPTIGISIGSANPTISNNTISNCYFGIHSAYTNSSIANNFISDCQIGIWIYAGNSNPIIENNFISGNTQTGIKIESGSFLIRNNTIIDNTNGITLNYYNQIINGGSPRILHNNIYANSEYNIDLGFSNDIDATNNWWGTTDTFAINQSIRDFKNDFNLGLVNFVPFITEPNNEAIPIPEFTLLAILPVVLTAIFLITIFKQKLTKHHRILGY